MKLKISQKILILAALLLLGLWHLPFVKADQVEENFSSSKAVIYYNEACGVCASYVADQLPQRLQKHGVKEFIKKDYVNNKDYRHELNQLTLQLDIPLEMQSHIMTFSGNLVLGGHVPAPIIDSLYKHQDSFKRVVVYQDKMHGEVDYYKILAQPNYASSFVGKPKKYDIDQDPLIYFDYLEKNKKELQVSSLKNSEGSLWPLVLATGFLDGLNPCAFAVLIFFIAFLFTLQRSVGNIFKFGLVYVLVIYLTYLGIGFGLFKAIVISGVPHLMAKVGAWLVIVLGLVNIKDYFLPHLPFHLSIPKFSQKGIKHWLTRATLPTVIVASFLVGLCTFPCSGGIYVAIIGLLASRGTFFEGLGYMLVYNLMFILPLIILLLLAGNKYALGRVAQWQSRSDKIIKFASGLVMIALGLIILIWFV